MGKERKNFYDIEELKRVNIAEVLAEYNIKVNRSGFFSIRSESKPSCKLYASTNSYYDFGDCKGGNPINLVEQLENCNREAAMEKVAAIGHIVPINTHDEKIEVVITDNQYECIGIHAEKATMNMTFDFERYTFEQNERLSEKYMMPMNELKEKHRHLYESIIKIKAFPHIKALRAEYEANMKEHYSFYCLFKTVNNMPIPNLPEREDIKNNFEELAAQLTRAEKILELVCEDSKKLEFKSHKYDAIEDYKKTAENLDLQELHEIIADNQLWVSCISDEDREKLAIPKDYNDMLPKRDLEYAAKKIEFNITQSKAGELKEKGIINKDDKNR